MKTTILVSAFGLLFGCSPSDRGARHERKAAEQRQAANKDLDKAHDQELKAAEDRNKAATDDQREPVAGREDGMMVRESLRTGLGDDWTIERSETGWTAVRKTAKKPDQDMAKKITDEQKHLRDGHKNVTATYHARNEITLRGSVDDCDDVGKTADKFGKIDGVNKIVVAMSCNQK